jgi:hypothetical protein
MTQSCARFALKLLLCGVALPTIAAQSEQAPLSPTGTDEQGATGQNRFFVSGDEANERMRRTKERLADPEQRAALRAEHRAAVVSQNAGVGRLVDLDPAMEHKLIELLTDMQMERLGRMHSFVDLQEEADEATLRMNALHELLGEEKLARFQDFEMNQSGRYWVGRFSARLAPADKLKPHQEDRLTALKQAQFHSASAALESRRAFRRPIGPLSSFEDMQRESQRYVGIESEESWRRRQVENRALERQARSFLSPTQLAVLSKYQAQEQDNLRAYVESARAEAGLNPNIPEQPEIAEEAPKLIDALVQVELRLTVNRQPMTVTHTVRTGESFTFQAVQGLIVEATPAMYERDSIDVHLKFYEVRATGRRRLSGGIIAIAQARQSDGSLASGGGGTVLTGRRGYALEASINAKVL